MSGPGGGGVASGAGAWTDSDRFTWSTIVDSFPGPTSGSCVSVVAGAWARGQVRAPVSGPIADAPGPTPPARARSTDAGPRTAPAPGIPRCPSPRRTAAHSCPDKARRAAAGGRREPVAGLRRRPRAAPPGSRPGRSSRVPPRPYQGLPDDLLHDGPRRDAMVHGFVLDRDDAVLGKGPVDGA